jgi:hypothetical protein
LCTHNILVCFCLSNCLKCNSLRQVRCSESKWPHNEAVNTGVLPNIERFDYDSSIETICLRQFVWDNSFETIRLRQLVWDNSFETIRLRQFVWDNSLETIRLRQLDWDNLFETIRLQFLDWDNLFVLLWCDDLTATIRLERFSCNT